MFSPHLQLLHQILHCHSFNAFFSNQIYLSYCLPLQQFFRFSFHPLPMSFLRRYSSSLCECCVTSPFIPIRQVSVRAGCVFRLYGWGSSSFPPSFIIMSSSQQSFTTSKAHLNQQNNLITLGEFIGNIALALAVIVVAAVLWKIYWHSLNKLTIRNIKNSRDEPIGPGHSILDNIKCLHNILKNLTNSQNGYVQDECGFQAFTYLFFLRRMIHLMAIFTLTDVFIWIPYMLIFDQPQQFSLISTDNSNYLFRTFYTLWTTVAVLYGLNDLKVYLRLLLKSRLFHGPNTSQNIVNNIKSKTMYIHFSGQKTKLQILQVKTRLVERLRVQDTILGIIEIPNNSKKIQLQYDYKIYEIVRSIGLHNFSSVWKMFKQTRSEVVRQRLLQRRDRLFRSRQRRHHAMDNFINQFDQERETHINSYLVAFEKISTCQQLISQVQAQRGCCDFLCEPRQRTDVQSFQLDQYDHYRLSVNWAQQPDDVIWINIGAPQRVKLFKYILFNGLSWLLISLGFVVIVLTQSRQIINIPKILLPIMLSIINATLRWLISKSSQWQNCHFQYQLQIKQMRVLLIFFSLNVIGGSLVRDTLNLIDILRTGWGFIQLFGLIYKHPDGFFYYIYIVNQLALTIFSALFKAGDIVPEVMDVNLTYEKNTQLRHHSKYGTNDIYRYGYMYSLDIIVFTIIFMYSASTPLIHFFGFIYFYGKYYVAGYTLVVFHKYEETCSNLRILQKVCDYLTIIMVKVIFLIGITLMFDGQYSSVLILYFWQGVILYLMYKDKAQSFKDYYTDDLLRNHDITQNIKEWKRQYMSSMQPLRYEQYQRLDLQEEDIE